jgi:actin related protein 2/3 complex subunit 1A/1B
MAQINQLYPPNEGISCHSWNADCSRLAVSPNSNEIHLYQNCQSSDFSSWQRTDVLSEHDLHISAVDWDPVSNRIVTCSHDRNGFVWTYDDAEQRWRPSLVILRIDKAAMDVRWSPDGNKFAVASSAKTIPVCHYMADQDWWVSKMIKKHKSTVTSVAWHPNSQVLATGSTDFKCKVWSARIEECDDSPDAGVFGASRPFSEVYYEFSSQGWIHDVAWSPNGNVLAFVGHDSSAHFVTFGGSDPVQQSIRFSDMPLQTIAFISDSALVGGGHDNNPFLFSSDGSAWSLNRKLDDPSANESKEETKAQSSSSFASARDIWNKKTRTGESGGGSSSKKAVHTNHDNAIGDVQFMSRGRVSTVATDGKLVLWDLASLGVQSSLL